MTKEVLNKKLLRLGYYLNVAAVVVWLLLAIMNVTDIKLSVFVFFTSLFGLIIVIALFTSIFVRNRFLYGLNIFSGFLALKTFFNINATCSWLLIYIVYAIYATLSIALLVIELKYPELSKKITDALGADA